MSTSTPNKNLSGIASGNDTGRKEKLETNGTSSQVPATPSKVPQTPSTSAPTTEMRTPQPSSLKGKRKADEVENTTPPDVRKQKATFAIDPRPHRISGTSGSSQAPSSYTRKKARLSHPGPQQMASLGEGVTSGPRPASRADSQRHAGNTGTWSSQTSNRGAIPFRTDSRASQVRPPSRAASTSKHQQGAQSTNPNAPPRSTSRAASRRGSISQASIPISALISPHAPSISTHTRATRFHMHDPRKPPKVQTTPWSLSLPQIGPGETLSSIERLRLGRVHRGGGGGDQEDQEGHILHRVGWTESGGSPLHAWLFFVGFVIFPVWWVAAIMRTPRTRRIGGLEGGQEEKKMAPLDDPQVEHDAKSWRRRCRIMAVVSLFTYLPFIILVAVFVSRGRRS